MYKFREGGPAGLCKKNKSNLFWWVAKTTLVNVLLVAICFAGILSAMLLSYEGGEDVSNEIIGRWDCIQFYKNQKSFQVPDT